MRCTIKLEATTEWGEFQTFDVGHLEPRVAGLEAKDVGLKLHEAKALLTELQRHIVQMQIDEKVMCRRICADCLKVQSIRDQRTRVLQALFGTVHVAAPRIRICDCVDTGPFHDLSFSPWSDILPDRSAPELRQVQADLGARHSFREASRLLAMLLPCSPPNHASARNRLRRVAEELHARDAAPAIASPSLGIESVGGDAGILVMIDGAHIRAVPGHQARHLDVTVGKVEAAGHPPRRFAFAPSGVDRPLSYIRAALTAQGWRPNVPVTVISDGEAALPELVRRATGANITHILDWWHTSMRVRHAEQALRGVYALKPKHLAGLDIVDYRLSRVRHLLSNGYHDEARRELFGFRHLASEAVYLNGTHLHAPMMRFLRHCDELHGYLGNNESALIDYGARYRAAQPISTSRAEGCVDEIANARMGKRRRMRWSARGAHRVAVVRATVLDGRLAVERMSIEAA